MSDDVFLNMEIACYQGQAISERKEKEKLLTQIKELKEEVFEAWQESDQWRITLEEALGVESDPKNHDMAWAYDMIIELKKKAKQSI